MPVGQAQKEFFVNEALARIDALLHPAFETVANTPPAVPAAGECWLVGPAPLGEWEGQADALAFWDGVQWSFCAPADGMQMFDRAEGQWILFRSGWRRATRPQTPTGGSTIDVEARAAIGAIIDAIATLSIIRNE